MIGLKRLLMIVFLVFVLSAEECLPEETVGLDEMVVVSSPVIEGNTVDRYGSGQTRVTQEQIEALNAQDMTSALRKTPGVNISRYNLVGAFGGGEGGAVFIRGMGSSRPGSEIKTWIDGVPMYMSIWNHPLMDLMPIDAGGTIEVYKSPQPQNFGNAMAGITLTPKSWTGQGQGGRAEFAAGSYGTSVVKAEAGGLSDSLDYYLGGGYRHSLGHRDHSGGETGNVYGRMGYCLNDTWNLSVFGLYSDNSADDPGKEGSDPSQRQGTYDTRASLASLTLANAGKALKGYIKAYANAGEGDWLDQPTGIDGVLEDLYNDFSFYGVKARETLLTQSGTEIIAGLDWEYMKGNYDIQYSNGTADAWNGHDVTLVSPFAAVSQEITISEKVSVIGSAGARYYENSDFDSAWSPHAGLILKAGNFSGHAGYSRGVVFPGLDVVVFSEEVLTALGDSWKNLDPEIMDHYETGVSYAHGELLKADLTWFYNNGKDRYVFVVSPGSKPVYDNVESYVTKGLEASLSIYPTSRLALFFGATIMQTDPPDLPYAPEVTLSAGLNWMFLENLTLNLDLQCQDGMYVVSQARKASAVNTQKVDGFTALNCKVSYDLDLPFPVRKLTLYIAGENLTDADYEYQYGYPMPGTSVMAGVIFIF
ncbi:MAG: TonB-dependent receptor plug domain-containing protein [Pseudomonadota bacterium]